MREPNEAAPTGECASQYGGNQCELNAGHTVPHLHWIEGYGDLTWTDEQAQAEHQKTVDYWAERGVTWPLVRPTRHAQLSPYDGDPRDTWYIASRTRHAPRWRALRAHGIDVVCSWIDEAGEGETSDWADLWARCELEVTDAHTFILYAEAGDGDMRGALYECGVRTACGWPVWYYTPDGFLRSLEKHPAFLKADPYIAHCIASVCAEVPAS